jgi:hypothetical protein
MSKVTLLDPTKEYRFADGKIYRYETAEQSASGHSGWTCEPSPSWSHHGTAEAVHESQYPVTEICVLNPGPNQMPVLITDPELMSRPPVVNSSAFVVLDSGVREEYPNGFVRDTEEGKEDFVRLFSDPKIHAAITKEPRLLDFLATEGAHLVPPEMLIRWAVHMHKGAQKYGEANWRQARGVVAVARFCRSFCRHSVKWLRGDRDEDHAVAIMFNVSARELTPEDE